MVSVSLCIECITCIEYEHYQNSYELGSMSLCIEYKHHTNSSKLGLHRYFEDAELMVTHRAQVSNIEA